MRRAGPTRWDFLWIGYAAPEDLARVWPARLRRRGRGLRTLAYVLTAAMVLGVTGWALATRQRALMGPLTGLVVLCVVAIRATDQRRLFMLPARRAARRRLSTLRLEPAELARQLERRRAFWRTALLSARPEHLQTPELALTFAGLVVAAAVVDQVLRAYLFSGIHSMFYIAVALAPTALYARRLARRDHRRLLDHACMNCGYPLAEVPTTWATAPRRPDAPAGSDNPVDHPIRERLGPERCPECGCHWPLVPPERTHKVKIAWTDEDDPAATGTSPS